MELFVNWNELVEALRLLRKAAGREVGGDVLLGYRSGDLVISIPGGETAVAARGQWSGCIRINADSFLRFSRIPVLDGDIRIAFGESRLQLGKTSLNATWQHDFERDIEVPLGATKADYLKILEENTAEQITLSGLSIPVGKIEKKRNAAVVKAFNLLKPYKVSLEDIEKLVQKRKERNVN